MPQLLHERTTLRNNYYRPGETVYELATRRDPDRRRRAFARELAQAEFAAARRLHKWEGRP